MSDAKDLLAQANVALDTERAASAAAIAALQTQVAALQAQLDPWRAVDKAGLADVTSQFQALIDKGLPVPAGRYLIDAVKGLTATRNVTMDPNAVLVVKPNGAPRYAVLTLGDDVTLTGGQILGDRLTHTYTAGSTHEWGYGLRVSGNNCTVTGTKISQCTGDGLGISGDNCTLNKVVSTQNRRQGMSIFSAPGFKAYDCEFSYTGAYLTDAAAPNGPCAGVDIEPDAMATVDAYFERCKFNNNRTGVLAWLRAEVGGNLNVTVKNCDIGYNVNGVQAKALAGKATMAVTVNRFAGNRNSNVRAEFGSAVTVTGNSSTGLASRYAVQAVGPSPLLPGVIVQSANTYT